MRENPPPYDNPKRRAYERRKKFLLEVLGAKCAKCPTVVDLQFDCITPCGSAHHGMGMYDRMIFYVLQNRIDNLQLLCRTCHQIKSAQDKFNRRENALAENRPSSSSSAKQASDGFASHAASKSSQPQRSDETDWQFQCRKVREQLGMP